jgi:hypothetical protein
MASIRAGAMVCRLSGSQEAAPGGDQKQYCYIQTMATGIPLCIAPRQETITPSPNYHSIRGDRDS